MIIISNVDMRCSLPYLNCRKLLKDTVKSTYHNEVEVLSKIPYTLSKD